MLRRKQVGKFEMTKLFVVTDAVNRSRRKYFLGKLWASSELDHISLQFENFWTNMETLLEQQRRYHEESERIIDAMVKETIHKKNTQREIINSEHRQKILLDVCTTSFSSSDVNHKIILSIFTLITSETYGLRQTFKGNL